MTAKDLLNKILDYKHPWEGQSKNSLPAKVRLQQINSLAEAFGLGMSRVNPKVEAWYSNGNKKNIFGRYIRLHRKDYLKKLTNLEYIIEGEFLHDRPEHETQKLANKLIIILTEIYPKSDRFHEVRKSDINNLFDYLINYRIKLYSLTYGGFGGMTEGFSSGLYHAFYLRTDLNLLIRENVQEIDNTLSLILDPESKDLSIDTLIKDFNYPQINLDAIDKEYKEY